MESDEDIRVRIDRFLTNPNAGSVTGRRRMGIEALMDLVEEEVRNAFPDLNIIRIGRDEFPKSFENVAILADSPEKSERIIELFETGIPKSVLFLSTRELCHQLPACIKGNPDIISKNTCG
jgi:hypothetical protein